MQSASLGLQWQAVRADGEGAAPAENVDTETEYLERRAADLREVQFLAFDKIHFLLHQHKQ
jgi:hypothetical protein